MSGPRSEPGESQMDVSEVVQRLEEDIVFGILHPRERLIEDELRARFGIKRHVVRQVLAELEQIGLVERKKNVGAYVKAYTVQEVIDLYSVREILETSAVQKIPMPVPEARLGRLIEIQGAHDRAVAEGDLRTAFRTNLDFHRALFSLTENAVLAAAIEDYAQRTHAIRSISVTVPETLEQARKEHWSMIEALREGRRDELIEVCRVHLRPSPDAYIAQYRQREAARPH